MRGVQPIKHRAKVHLPIIGERDATTVGEIDGNASGVTRFDAFGQRGNAEGFAERVNDALGDETRIAFTVDGGIGAHGALGERDTENPRSPNGVAVGIAPGIRGHVALDAVNGISVHKHLAVDLGGCRVRGRNLDPLTGVVDFGEGVGLEGEGEGFRAVIVEHRKNVVVRRHTQGADRGVFLGKLVRDCGEGEGLGHRGHCV